MPLAQLLRRQGTLQHRDTAGVIVSENAVGAHLEPMGDVMPDNEEPWVVAAETYRSTWLLFLPAQTVVGAADSFIIDGESFEIVDVQRMFNPRRQTESHVQCTATRTAPPDALMTVQRPDTTGDDYAGQPTPATIATDVRTWFTATTGTESTTGSQEMVLFIFRCDPVDLEHFDLLVDQASGIVYEVVWVVPKGTAAGRAHNEGEMRLIQGAPS